MAAKLTLYGLEVSPYVQRVAMVLRECGVEEWETVPTHPLKGETRHPDFLALNPVGRIPVLQDAGLTLFESRAIARYLLEKFPETGEELLGRGIRERAEVGKWVEVEAAKYNDIIAAVIRHSLFSKLMGQPTDEAALKEAAGKLAELLDVYEKHLAQHQFLALNRVTFADLTHLPHTAMLEAAGFGHLISERPHVAKWWESIRTRPAWVKVSEGPTIPKMVAAKEAQEKLAAA